MQHLVQYTVIYPAGVLPPGYELPEGEVLGQRSLEDSFFATVDALPEVGAVQCYSDRDWQVTAVAEYRSQQAPWTFALVTLSQDGFTSQSDWSHEPPVLSLELEDGQVPYNDEGVQAYDLCNPRYLNKEGFMLFYPVNGRPIAGYDLVAIRQASVLAAA